eukprot:COSAG01_NODE_2403_length_7757_cov_4.745887_2_plen_209_part_00
MRAAPARRAGGPLSRLRRRRRLASTPCRLWRDRPEPATQKPSCNDLFFNPRARHRMSTHAKRLRAQCAPTAAAAHLMCPAALYCCHRRRRRRCHRHSSRCVEERVRCRQHQPIALSEPHRVALPLAPAAHGHRVAIAQKLARLAGVAERHVLGPPPAPINNPHTPRSTTATATSQPQTVCHAARPPGAPRDCAGGSDRQPLDRCVQST